MKLGYEMKNSTILAPPSTANRLAQTAFSLASVDVLSRQIDEQTIKACKESKVDAWAVVDYISGTIHLVASEGAVETYMPVYSSIECSKLK